MHNGWLKTEYLPPDSRQKTKHTFYICQKKLELYFILVEPAVPGNVGSVARALKNMGFENLRLVNPCSHLAPEALMMAHGAHDILQNASVFHHFSEAVSDLDFLIGTTAKKRRVRYNYHPPEALPEILLSKKSLLQKVGIVFGREEHGLHNEELEKCDILTSIPMAVTYPSLNLAQSVMIYAWELASLHIAGSRKQSNAHASGAVMKILKERVHLLLTEVGIGPDSILYPRIMERLMLLSEEDVHLVLSFLKAYFASK